MALFSAWSWQLLIHSCCNCLVSAHYWAQLSFVLTTQAGMLTLPPTPQDCRVCHHNPIPPAPESRSELQAVFGIPIFEPPPLLFLIHPPSDASMCGSRRRVCVLSRESFVELQLFDFWLQGGRSEGPLSTPCCWHHLPHPLYMLRILTLGHICCKHFSSYFLLTLKSLNLQISPLFCFTCCFKI